MRPKQQTVSLMFFCIFLSKNYYYRSFVMKIGERARPE